MRRKTIPPGTKYGHLTVIAPGEPRKSGNHPSTSICECECGKRVVVENGELKRGNIKSCGCKHDECRVVHNGHGTRLYTMWKNIRQRTNGKSKSPRNRTYVERGIKVCSEWDDFTAFRAFALSHGYRDDLTIDRIDPMGNYCPENVRFIPASEQSKNRIYTKKRKSA